jgi:DNA-binding transcriptional MerR regulator
MAEFFCGEVSRLAGFEKPWMLNYLERSEIFVRETATDRRHGKVRKYTFRDIVVLRAIKKMLDVGLRPVRVKEVLQNLATEEGLPNTREAAQLFAKNTNSMFFISKDAVLFAKSDDEILDLTSGRQLSFSFMVSVRSIIEEVATVTESYEVKRTNNWKIDAPILESLCQAAGL